MAAEASARLILSERDGAEEEQPTEAGTEIPQPAAAAPTSPAPPPAPSPVSQQQQDSKPEPEPPAYLVKAVSQESVDSWVIAQGSPSSDLPAKSTSTSPGMVTDAIPPNASNTVASPISADASASAPIQGRPPASAVSPDSTNSPRLLGAAAPNSFSSSSSTSFSSISSTSSPSTESTDSAVTEYSDPDEVDDEEAQEPEPAEVPTAEGTRGLAWLTDNVLAEMLADRPGARLVGMRAELARLDAEVAGADTELALAITRLTLVHQPAGGGRSGCRRRRLIVKSLPRAQAGGDCGELEQLAAQLRREAALYRSLLPALAARAGRGAPPLFARFFPVSAPAVLVLADLRARGYSPQPRHRQLGSAHCSAALAALARLHALSLALRRDRPAAIERLQRMPEPLYPPQGRDQLRVQLEPLLVELAAQIAAWPGLELLAPKVRAHAAPMADWLERYFALDRGAFSVLTHGDLRSGNVLFLHGPNGDVRDVRFSGFHCARWAPAVSDVLQFLVMCPRPEVRAEAGGLAGMLARYRAALAAELAAAGLPAELAPPLERLMQEAKDAGPLALFVACAVLPAVLAEPPPPPLGSGRSPASSPASSDSEAPLLGPASPTFGAGAGRPPAPVLLSGPLFRERLPGLLQELDTLGWL